MKQKNKPAFFKYLPVIIAAVVGAVGGYLYYRFIGCATGTCAITSNPYISTLYGGIIGGVIGIALAPDADSSCAAEKGEEKSCE